MMNVQLLLAIILVEIMMIGIDIIENERVKQKKGVLIKQILTENEKAYIEKFANNTERLCGIFCAKEAIKKAFGCAEKLPFKKIEILHDENQKPYANFDSSLNDIVKDKKVEISISHSKTVTVAVAIVI